MASIPQNLANLHIQPRRSTETDRRPLLSDSLAASETASLISQPYARHNDDDGEATPRAQSPAPTARRETLATATPQPYRGFPSEAHYLAALRAWAEEKKYIRYDTGLKGFYGERTVEEYASQPPVSLGIREKWRARKEKRGRGEAGGKGRRNTLA